MQYIVYEDHIEAISEGSEEKIVNLCFAGKTVYLHDTSRLEFTDCDCVSVYYPLDKEKIESSIGKNELEIELENANDYGYVWFENIQNGE